VTKRELIAQLARAHPHLTRRHARVVVATIFAEVAAAMSRGDRVDLRGFGSFGVRRLGARDGHHPGTGRRVGRPEKRFPVFRASRLLSARLGPTE
jgi:integration host factor subunit beta